MIARLMMVVIALALPAEQGSAHSLADPALSFVIAERADGANGGRKPGVRLAWAGTIAELEMRLEIDPVRPELEPAAEPAETASRPKTPARAEWNSQRPASAQAKPTVPRAAARQKSEPRAASRTKAAPARAAARTKAPPARAAAAPRRQPAAVAAQPEKAKKKCGVVRRALPPSDLNFTLSGGYREARC